jgi:hypothetical protein
MSLRRIDHSSRGVLTNVARRCVWSRNLEHEGSKVLYRAVKIQPQWVVTPGKQTNHAFDTGCVISNASSEYWPWLVTEILIQQLNQLPRRCASVAYVQNWKLYFMLLSGAGKKMSVLLRHDKAKNSEFEAISSAGLLKDVSFGVVSMQNLKCTEKAGSNLNSSNVYLRGGGGGLWKRFRLMSVSVRPPPCECWSFRCGLA